jgi:cytochrome P450
MTATVTCEPGSGRVPPELAVPDFDFFAIPVPDGDPALAWKQATEALPPIFWTDMNGGHWVATRAVDIETIQLDPDRFSMRYMALPKGRRGMRSPPLDFDPPEHASYRAVISPIFSPKAVARLETNIRTVIRDVIAHVEPRGECEFVDEVSHVLPITVFLDMMGLPREDSDMLLRLSALNTTATELQVTQRARHDMADYLWRDVQDRRANPKDDALTTVVQGRVDGRPLTDEEIRGMSTLLLAGGLHTVASMMGNIMRFLALHPAHRQQLVDDPKLIPRAIDEMIRRHGIANTARIVTRDFEFRGVPLRQGDMIQIPNCLYGLDPERVENPLEVDFHRPLPIPSAAFGNGPHRCPGMALGRIEIRVLLEEWLARIPQFAIKPGTVPRAAVGTSNTMHELFLAWTPSAT